MDGEEAAVAAMDAVKSEGHMASAAKPSPAHHRRSKSASDRNLDSVIHGNLHFKAKDSTKYQGSNNVLNILKSHGGQGSCNQSSTDGTASNTTRNSRASLEDDIKQLQMHLHQEKSTRFLLEKAIGRASSTLSPGHRNFSAQTRELIAEIEILEEEIANREQHVLSLYRSIFDQCASQPTSAHSSGMTSPAHSKVGARKHPSIISSSFCSSKKFRLPPLQVLSSIREARRGDVLLKPPKFRHEHESRENMNVYGGKSFEDTLKEKLSVSGRTSLARTLKDHLYQCPCRISEEMVRCMASTYSWVRSDSTEKSIRSRAPFLQRSSTSTVVRPKGAREGNEWFGKSMIEVLSIKLDRQCPRVSYTISNYRFLVEQLERVDVSVMENSAKLSFWINIYNSLVMHAYLVYGVPSSSLRRIALFNKAAYNIGGQVITANCIEYSILCCRTSRMGRWFETILSSAMRKKCGEEKQWSNIGLPKCQPLVFFAMCTGASSDPMLRVYSAKNVVEQLDKAKKEFLQTHVLVKRSSRVFLPKVVDRYAREACLSCDNLLMWVSEDMDKRQQDAIRKCMNSCNKRKASQVIEWLPYDTRFRYVLASELLEINPGGCNFPSEF